MARRGYVPEDEKQFRGKQLETLRKAAGEVQFLLDRGYETKPVTTFIGNHYMLSERQRLALVRSVSSRERIADRKRREMPMEKKKRLSETVSIDGFNTVITLETALSGSPVFYCGDGAIRDLAGLRGTYRIIDKTAEAVDLILETLDSLNIGNACFYLDSPVSNSGRLSGLIRDRAKGYHVEVSTCIINDVDGTLKRRESVVSSDSFILDGCVSWLNIMPKIVEGIEGAWVIRLQ